MERMARAPEPRPAGPRSAAHRRGAKVPRCNAGPLLLVVVALLAAAAWSVLAAPQARAGAEDGAPPGTEVGDAIRALESPFLLEREQGVRELIRLGREARAAVAEAFGKATATTRASLVRVMAADGSAEALATLLDTLVGADTALATAIERALVEHADLVSVWELILPRSRVEARLGALADIKASRSIQIHYSILRAVDEAASSGKHFAHAINHGLAFDEIRGMETALRESRFRHAIDGLSYRIPRDGRPDIELPAISEFCSQQGMDCSIHVRLAAEDPAQSMCNDLANANRVAETLFASVLVRPGTGIFLDTFDDVDRSFFRRNGLCDRRFNPRMAGRVFRHLQAALPRRPTGARPINLKVGGVTGMEIANAVWILAAAPSELDVRQLRLALGEASTQPTGDIVDLASGERSALSAAPERLVISNPTLVILSRVEPAGCAQPSGLDT